ncbi:DUF2231 domain-containing protein [Billgrantia kenyensis]|uniref:Heme ABC transporter permease n=1 Tax=Billgrantia kenyensis TaxID=321266 RepID=A0A7V9VZM0_9GAMM|nr:DUF2231 domain-containing protein [Halomonas kenyensis]MBA2778327.1 heme ABC transporter permease [Halomonas kenyensis]MCG6660634.1 heme ABC transporter permease [Halomonas kenyensis]
MLSLHHILIHFPIGLWLLGTLLILLGAMTNGRLAENSRTALLPVLVVGLLGAVVSLISGVLIWPMEANLHSPMIRNHILMALWTVAVFGLLTLLVWRAGAAAFEGARRWVLVILSLYGSLLLMTTGTLGGYLAGAASPFSNLLRWNVFTTYYSPTWVVAVMVLVGLAGGYLWYRGRQPA